MTLKVRRKIFFSLINSRKSSAALRNSLEIDPALYLYILGWIGSRCELKPVDEDRIRPVPLFVKLTKQHESVDVVYLVGPEGGEDEVHLDEDAAEGEDPTQQDDGQRLHEPFLLGDRPRYRIHPDKRSSSVSNPYSIESGS